MPCDGGHILVVEDDDATRDALADAFAQVCGAVHVARDGREALDLLERGVVPCVVVTDVEMPRMGGAELVAALASRGLGDVPVITMSGGRFVPAPGAMHLRKPFTWDDLTRAVLTCTGEECRLRAIASSGGGECT